MGYSENATDKGARIPPGNRVSSERGGNSRNGVNRVGAAPDGADGGSGRTRRGRCPYPECPGPIYPAQRTEHHRESGVASPLFRPARHELPRGTQGEMQEPPRHPDANIQTAKV